MPEDKDFKRLVRARMQETGERYTDARSELRPGATAAGGNETATTERDQQRSPDRRRTCRDVAAELTFEEIAAAASLGIGPNEIRDYLDAMPGLTLGEVQGAWVLGLDARALRAYREVLPDANLEDLEGAFVLGVTPAVARRYVDAQAGMSLDEIEQAWTVRLEPERIGSTSDGS